MKNTFENQVALVTGAGSGMGLATAKSFAEAGACVVLADIDFASVEKAVGALKAQRYQALALQCDVSDERQVKAMVEKTVGTFGKLDMAFNNAGIMSRDTDTADVTAEEFDRVININLRSVWLCMKYELQQMRKQKAGAIVNCSSIGGLIGLPGRAAYHAAKHGVLGLTKSAAIEYAPRGIHINAVCPGTIDTPMVHSMMESGVLTDEFIKRTQPIGRVGYAQEVADVVLWLCGPASTLIIGQSIAVDGGYTIQ